jgi:hypothetical protein
VRHPIAGQVQHEAEWKRAAPRAGERAADRARRDVEGDDQRGLDPSSAAASCERELIPSLR